MNIMKGIKVEKVTLNIGAGKDQNKLDKGIALIESLTGIKPVKTITNKRIMGWGLRPGLPIGCKLTLRKEKAMELIPRLLYAKDNILDERWFDENGNIAFGIPEYIDIQDAKYDAKIGVMGLQVCITLERPGYRVKKKKMKKGSIGKNHKIKKEEAIEFMKKEFNVKVGEKE